MSLESAKKTADADVAQKLASIDLTERLTQSVLTSLTKEFKPGPQTLEELELL
ncbi:hypothetical protein ACPOL_3537 [Acidisarcina polymorpha]|uniref:Uncharacterized protein n=1 Tax=Acidisarcina polymorpha TaxID=2211140 RepID=A0A2Z5G139_9BACT|nr:hypothetical protein ACPOL_3537 [Acidisarcina polymorpha]